MYKNFLISLASIVIAVSLFQEFGLWAGICSLIPLIFINRYLNKSFAAKKNRQQAAKSPPQPDKAAKYYFNMGYALARKGFHDDAIDYFTKSIAINPKEPNPYFNRGLVYVEKKLYDNAVESFDQTIAIDPKYSHAYLAKASLCEKFLNRPDEAVKCYHKFLQYAPPEHKDISSVKQRLAELGD